MPCMVAGSFYAMDRYQIFEGNSNSRGSAVPSKCMYRELTVNNVYVHLLELIENSIQAQCM